MCYGCVVGCCVLFWWRNRLICCGRILCWICWGWCSCLVGLGYGIWCGCGLLVWLFSVLVFWCWNSVVDVLGIDCGLLLGCCICWFWWWWVLILIGWWWWFVCLFLIVLGWFFWICWWLLIVSMVFGLMNRLLIRFVGVVCCWFWLVWEEFVVWVFWMGRYCEIIGFCWWLLCLLLFCVGCCVGFGCVVLVFLGFWCFVVLLVCLVGLRLGIVCCCLV